MRGTAFTETIVKTMSWDEFPAAGRDLFRAFKTTGVGEAMVLDCDIFDGLPGTVATRLGAEDLDAYRKPYPTRDSRLPLLRWTRAMPLGGDPADVTARVHNYDEWLTTSTDVPKLMLTFEPGPGTMMTPQLIDWCTANIASLEIADHELVAGHHTPEDHPEAIATAVASWMDSHNLRS